MREGPVKGGGIIMKIPGNSAKIDKKPSQFGHKRSFLRVLSHYLAQDEYFLLKYALIKH